MTPTSSSSLRALFLLWLGGNGLRLTILAVPPILALIIPDLGLSGTQVGILNAIPVSLFALVAVPGSLLIARVGAFNALVVGLLIAAGGSAARGFAVDAHTLFAATVLMAAGVAVMQPALPPLVRQWLPHRIGFATAVYTNGLLCGEIFPVVLAALVVPLLGGGWRPSLELWSIVSAVIAVVIFVMRPQGGDGAAAHTRRWMPDWRDPLLWKVGLVAAANNQLYFCTNAFLPGLLLQNGHTDLIRPALSALNAGQLPGSLFLLVAASHLERKKWPFIFCGVFGLLSILGVATATNLWIVVCAAGFIGFAAAVSLTLVLTLPALLVAPDDVPRMSAGVFTIGYGTAMVVSLIGGVLWDATGSAAFAFLPIAVAILPMVLVPPLIDLRTQRS
ncbi:MAG TPA: MFS transporter [Nitrobacter sp.]|jgi:CP family cyanate transporter-like MFS transporter|nr:MFS transporter [Nitrobacter sp.]